MPSTLIMARSREVDKEGHDEVALHAVASIAAGSAEFTNSATRRHAAEPQLAVPLVLADQVRALVEVDSGHLGIARRRDRVGISRQQQERDVRCERHLELCVDWAARAMTRKSPRASPAGTSPCSWRRCRLGRLWLSSRNGMSSVHMTALCMPSASASDIAIAVIMNCAASGTKLPSPAS